MHTIRPREYASRIAELPTLEERREALNEVPQEYLAMVKTHIQLIFRLRKAKR